MVARSKHAAMMHCNARFFCMYPACITAGSPENAENIKDVNNKTNDCFQQVFEIALARQSHRKSPNKA